MKKLAVLLTVMLVLAIAVPVTTNAATKSASAVKRVSVVTLATACLSPTGDSTATGAALLERNLRTGRTIITVMVNGLKPNSSHAAHIHANSCSGPIVITLRNVVADKDGCGFSRTVIRPRINATKWWVNVHRDPTLPSPGITCGKVKARSSVIIRTR